MAVHPIPHPTLHQQLRADAAALVRLMLGSLPPQQRLLVAGLSRVQGLDLEATAQSSVDRLGARHLEVLAAAVADHLQADLAAAGLAGEYTADEVDRALAALGDVLGR